MTTPSPAPDARDRDPAPPAGARWLAIGVAAALAALFLVRGGVWDHVGGRDTHAMFVSLYEASGRALRELRLPLWNPYEFFGTPLLGSGQGGMLYPPVPLLFAVLPARWALQALYVLHMALFVVASMRYATRHGVAALAAPLAPLLGIAGLFSGLAYGGIDHPSFLCELAWLPVLLLGLDRALESDTGRGVALIALAWAAQWLAGYPDFAFNSAVLVALAAALHPRGSVARRAAVLLAGLGLGAALAAPQILALRETALESVRQEHLHNYALFRERALRVRSLADLERGPLKLVFLPALAIAAVALARLDRIRLFWAIALLWCALPLNPPFALLYAVPPFSGSRVPAWGFMGGTFLGLLSAAGLTTALASRRTLLRAAAAAVAIGVTVHAVVVVGRAPTLLRGGAPDYALLVERAAIVRDVAATLDPPPRFLGAADVDGGAPLRHQLRSPTGYEPALPPRRAVGLLKALGLHESPGWGRWPGVAREPELAALAGIGLVATRPEGVPALEAVGFRRMRELPGGDVLLYRTPLPRARIMHRAEVVPDDFASLRRILQSAGEAPERVLLEGAAGSAATAGLAPAPPAAIETAQIRIDEPEHVAVDVDVASGGFLVLTDAWAPGWQATLDGHPVPVLPADHVFRAIAVPAGTHTVELRYRPRWLIASLVGSGVAALSIVGLLARARRAAPSSAAVHAAEPEP